MPALTTHYRGPLAPRADGEGLDPACEGPYGVTDRVWNRPDETTCPACLLILHRAGVQVTSDADLLARLREVVRSPRGGAQVQVLGEWVDVRFDSGRYDDAACLSLDNLKMILEMTDK